MKFYFCFVFIFCSFYNVGYSAPNVNTVSSCNDVIDLYTRSGYNVVDCLLQNVDPNFPTLFWRVDMKMSQSLGRAACKLVNLGDLACIHSTADQNALIDLFTGKFLLDAWLWIGATKINGTFWWLDGPEQIPKGRLYPDVGSTNNGDCMVLLKLGDSEGENDVAGSYYYSQDCMAKNIPVCFAGAV